MYTIFLVLAALACRGHGRRMNRAREPHRHRGIADPGTEQRGFLDIVNPRAAWQAPGAMLWGSPARSLQSRDSVVTMKGSIQEELDLDANPANGSGAQIVNSLEAAKAEVAALSAELVELEAAEKKDREAQQHSAEAGHALHEAEEEVASETNSSEALNAALDALEDDIKQVLPLQDSDQNSYSSKSVLKSQALRDLEGLALEARSFVVGVREQLAELRENVVERVKLEAAAAASVADFALRKLTMETLAAGRVLQVQQGQANSSEDSVSAARSKAMPFTTRLSQIERKRAEGQSDNSVNSTENVGLLLVSQAEAEWTQQAAKQQESVQEAVNVVKEASEWAAAFVIALTGQVSEALQGDKKTKGKDIQKQQGSQTIQFPQLSTITSRAQTVGSALQDAAAATIATTRADYASYLQLKRRGQLPTLTEEFQSLVPPGIAVLQASKPKLLSSLELGKSATKLRERIEFEGAVKQLRLAAALGNRAVKDSGDTLVFGALPAVSAVGKVAARRLSYAVPQLGVGSVPIADKAANAQPGIPAPAGVGGGKASIVREVAQQLSIEYAAVARAGAQAGILPDFTEAMGGSSSRLLKSLSNVLPATVSAKLQYATAGDRLTTPQVSPDSAIVDVEALRAKAPSTLRQLGAALGPQVGLSEKTVRELFDRILTDRAGLTIGNKNSMRSVWERASSSSGMGNVVLEDGEVVVIDGPTSRMPADEDLEARIDASSTEEECDITIDVGCESVEEIKDVTVMDQLVTAIDLIALTAEVGADTITPAVERATDVIAEGTGIGDWKVLPSLTPEAVDRRQRSETARQELLETFTKVIERD